MFENFGAQGPISTPGEMQSPQAMIDPALIQRIKSMITPMTGSTQKMVTPGQVQIPGIMGKFQAPTGDRNLGGINQQGPQAGLPTQDPGNKNIAQQYGHDGVLDLAQMLNQLSGKPMGFEAEPENSAIPISQEEAIKILTEHGFKPETQTGYDPKTQSDVPGTSFLDAFGQKDMYDKKSIMDWLGY